jgi:predicted metal-dependent hydrolase
VKVVHIKQPNRKTYSLQFDSEGVLVVKTDTRYFGNKLDEILKKHKKWIKTNFIKIKEQLSLLNTDYISRGRRYNLFGEEYFLEFDTKDQNFLTIQFIGQKILITQPYFDGFSKARIRVELINFFKDVFRTYIENRVEYWAEKMNLKYNRIFIRSQKTKWGSCSSQKNLNFNWHLIFAPKKVIDYVIIHELAHLKHMNHSSKFWDFVKKYDRNYKSNILWLKANENITRILN